MSDGIEDSIGKKEEYKPVTGKGNRGDGSAEEFDKDSKLDEGGNGGGEEEVEEVEALSHKEMRRRKKVGKQAAREGGSTTLGVPTVHPSRAAAVAFANTSATLDGARKGKHSIWIGNLLFSTSAERLQEWLEEKGIAGISRVHMPRGQRKMDHNRGFAYVDVPSATTVQSCIDLSESHLDGRKLLIKSGSDYSGRPELDKKAVELAGGIVQPSVENNTSGDALVAPFPKGKTGLTKTAQKILRAQKHSPGPTLFVGNLSFNSTEDGLREMIERSAAARDAWTNGKAKRKKEDKETERKGKAEQDSDEGENEEEKSEQSSSDGESSNEDNVGLDGKVKKAKEKEKSKDKKAEGLRGAGIRKIRMGQFEDTGKCKGFAFIDFFSPAYATASLIDPHNAKLDGRELLLQFASADAVRRGAPKGQMIGPRPAARENRRPPKRQFEDTLQERKDIKEDLGPAPEPGTFDPDAPLIKKHKDTKEERQKRREALGSSTRRTKPGAALANAQRGKTGIDLDAPKAIKKTFD